MKVTLKHFVQIIAKGNGFTLETIGDSIGRRNQSLGFSLRNETLTVKDLTKCFESVGEPLVVKFQGNEYEIELKTLKS